MLPKGPEIIYDTAVDPVIFQEAFICSSAFLRGGSARSLLGDWVNLNRPFWDSKEAQ